jgi:hypothetical protein
LALLVLDELADAPPPEADEDEQPVSAARLG